VALILLRHSSYNIDDEQILVTGEFKERTLITVYEKTGESEGPHVFYHMQIQLLIKIGKLRIL